MGAYTLSLAPKCFFQTESILLLIFSLIIGESLAHCILETKNSLKGELFVRVARYLKIGRISSPASPFVRLPQGALGTSVNQLSLFTATFAPLGNPPHNGG